MKALLLLSIGFAMICLPFPTRAATTLSWDTAVTAGVQEGSSTWNFNSTSGWTTDGTTFLKWTDNGNYASFTDNTTQNVTISDTNGQVGAAGLLFATGNSTKAVTLLGDAFQLGSGGMVVSGSAGTVNISAPLVLTASQTWSSTHGLVKVSGGLSSLSGTTNLIIDGRGVSGAGADLTGTTTLNGSMTVTGGGTLEFDYSTSVTTRLNGNTLILAGGKMSLNGGSTSFNGGQTYLEAVPNLVVGPGANFILDPASTGSFNPVLSVSALTHMMGGTLIGQNNAVTGLDITSSAVDTSGIVGSWAVAGNGYWMVSNGLTSASGGTAGSTVSTDPGTGWTAGKLVNYTGTGFTGAGSATIANLVIGTPTTTPAVTLGFAAGSLLTVTDGGISDPASRSIATITGGSITTGLADGELFVYNFSSTSSATPFVINSAIVDNGSTPTTLVYTGSGTGATLQLGGTNTYTGSTYVNAGTLKLASGGSISQSKAYIVNAGATLDVSTTGLNVGITSAGVHQQLNGGGTILGAVTVASGGTIAPAVAIPTASGGTQMVTGTMNVGSLTLLAGSALSFRIGTNSDLINLTSTGVALTGTFSPGSITLNLFDAGGVADQNYTLMQWVGGTASFNISDFNVVTNDGISGSLSIVGNSLVFDVVSVPEPGTWVLLAGGLFLVAFRPALRAGKRVFSVQS